MSKTTTDTDNIKDKKVFVIVENGKAKDKVYTSLKSACEDAGVSYSSASKGTACFMKKNDEGSFYFVVVRQCELVKIKGRGKIK